MSIKSFQDLIEEVHEKGICQECGGCVSFCSSVDYNVIGFEEPYSPPVYINKDKCLECGICYYLCPQTHILDDELNKTYKFTDFESMPLGHFEDIFSCQSNDPDFLKYGTDGGVVNSIINYMIEKKLIDGAIVAKIQGPFSREAMFAGNKMDLIKGSGTKLEIANQLDQIQNFCTYTRSIPELNHYKFKKLAIVGTPCQIYTIRCMQNLGVTPSEYIEICLGLFCYHNFLFNKAQIERFEKDFDIKFENITKINIKEDLIVKTDGKVVHIPFDKIVDYVRPACFSCADFTNIYSDISFGGLGSPDKYTTVIPRTEKGRKLFRKVLDEKIIKKLELDAPEKNRARDLIKKFSKSKMEREVSFVKNV
ncbi:MAG: Coenzyme F420 hydrogenase/dehydrogenase, beta subunit C-terminal domain [Candidatus Hermodarchaeota archaeon]